MVVAPPAGAHSLGGTEPSNYRTRVLGVRPALDGVSVEVVDAGTRLRLHNRSGQEVVVLGYAGRALAAGRARPVRHLARPPRPLGGRRAARPGRGGRPGRRRWPFPNWTVKLRTGRRLVDVVGEVRWVPGPSPLPWLAGAALLAMAVVAAGRSRRWRERPGGRARPGGGPRPGPAGRRLVGAQAPLAGELLSLGASAAGWVLAALAVRQLLRRRVESGLFQLLLAAGLLTVVSGLGDLGFLLRSQLASGLPDWMVRAAVAAKLGLGVGALTAAALQLRVTVRDSGPRQRGRGRPTGRARPTPVDIDEHPPSCRLRSPSGGPNVAGGVRAVASAGRRASANRAAALDLGHGAAVAGTPPSRRLLDDPDLPGGA